MTLSYFPNGNWSSTSREERYFCQALFQRIKESEQKFVKFLNAKAGLGLNESDSWEIGYEVCLYRDVLHARGQPNSSEYSIKRTFDLCLFSEQQVVVIEAKAQQTFKPREMESIKLDKSRIQKLLKTDTKAFAVAIASSTYFENHSKHSLNKDLLNSFDARISWEELYQGFCADPLFLQANVIYKQGRNTNA